MTKSLCSQSFISWAGRLSFVPSQHPVLVFGGLLHHCGINPLLLGGRCISDEIRKRGGGKNFGFALNMVDILERTREGLVQQRFFQFVERGELALVEGFEAVGFFA